MVKIKIRRRVKRRKPIKILNNREFVFKRRPIVINYIPQEKPQEKEKGKKELQQKEKKELQKPLLTQEQVDMLKRLLGGRDYLRAPLSPIRREMTLKKERQSVEGVSFPKIESEVKPIERRFKKSELTKTDIKYPLIPRNPRRNEEIYAYAHIYWDQKNNELKYDVVEPDLTESDKKLLNIFKEFIRDKLDIDFAAVKKFEARNYLYKKIDDALEYFRVDVPETLIKIFRYYINRDFLGLEKIEPLLQDEHIEDISCDGTNTPIYIVHRDPRFGSIKTNIVFEEAEELDSFVMKLAQRCGRDISMAHPLLNGILPDNSRVQATLATDIARKGSNFTIRKFSKEPFTPTIQILYHTSDVKLMAYLWYVIENGRSILISGGTGSGKTSLLNSISMFFQPQEKIVSIEDTGELQLPHPNWIPEVARETIAEGGGKNSVTLFDLLRESLRQRPDRIVVGEVRGKEVFILFQAMSTGHPGLATIHAESIETLIDRLITPPINLPVSLLETLDLVVFISRVKIGDKTVRRLTSIEEIAGVDYNKKRPIINTFSKWNPRKDEFEIQNSSVVLRNIIERTGVDRKRMEEDIINKAKVLEWLSQNKITDYKNFGKYLAQYNSNPNEFLRRIGKL